MIYLVEQTEGEPDERRRMTHGFYALRGVYSTAEDGVNAAAIATENAAAIATTMTNNAVAAIATENAVAATSSAASIQFFFTKKTNNKK